jgi:acyl-CoA synthetase (NDP forming)
MTDRAELEGLKVPMLSEKTIASLEKIIPPQGTSVKNPLDVGRTAMMGENLISLIELLRDDPKVDALIFSQPLGPLYQFTGRQGINFLLDITVGAKDKLEKPLFIVMEKENGFVPDTIVKEAEERYHEKNVATFPNFQMAARVMRNLSDYQIFLSSGVPLNN